MTICHLLPSAAERFGVQSFYDTGHLSTVSTRLGIKQRMKQQSLLQGRQRINVGNVA
jgi:hypothetical protein